MFCGEDQTSCRQIKGGTFDKIIMCFIFLYCAKEYFICNIYEWICEDICAVSATCWISFSDRFPWNVRRELFYILVSDIHLVKAKELISKVNWHLVKCDWTSLQRGIEVWWKFLRRRTFMTQPTIQWSTWKETDFFERLVKRLRSYRYF